MSSDREGGGSGIRFDRVSVSCGGTTVLDSLDLTVEPGEIMALLGPSGSGRPRRCGRSPGSCGPRPGGIQYSTPGVAGDGTAALIKAMHDSVAKSQQQVSSIGGGFPARKDVKATDANAIGLTELMTCVEIFEPDWTEIDKNLQSYVENWKSATGS